MSWTKLQLVDEAFAELALAGYVFDLQPEEQQTAARRLDAQMAVWEAKGIKLGYAGPGDLDVDSGIPDAAVEPVYMNLALRLAAAFGKTPLATTVQAANDGYATLLWAAAAPPQQQLPNTLPRGQGNKPWRRTVSPFMPAPDPSPLGNTPGGDLNVLE